jgi:hypothetical protein
MDCKQMLLSVGALNAKCSVSLMWSASCKVSKHFLVLPYSLMAQALPTKSDDYICSKHVGSCDSSIEDMLACVYMGTADIDFPSSSMKQH